MGARCVGIARRALEMLCSYAKQRVTFGVAWRPAGGAVVDRGRGARASTPAG
jgi:alkylation response protein AidB-like acyl-CoA dehydrogenase